MDRGRSTTTDPGATSSVRRAPGNARVRPARQPATARREPRAQIAPAAARTDPWTRPRTGNSSGTRQLVPPALNGRVTTARAAARHDRAAAIAAAECRAAVVV